MTYTGPSASEVRAHITANKGVSITSGEINIDSANIRGMFSGSGDISYNSGTGAFSLDVETVYTADNFDSDYILAKDSANTSIERNKHIDSAEFTVTVATKTSDHVYEGSGSSSGYVIDGTQSPILNLKIGRTYQFNLSSSDMSSHPFRFYYDAAKTTQYTTNVTTGATFARILITEATPPVLHYQCSAHGYMGHALQIGTRNLTGFTTTNLTEGTNLYYTDGRFDTRLASKSTSNLTEGSNLYFTNARAQAVSIDSAEAIALIDSAYVQARQLPSTDSAATQAMIDSNFANGDSATFAGNIRADGGNLIMGDEAYSTSTAYVGMKTSNMTNASDYMIISGTSDGTTYISAKAGASVSIRAGGNVSTHSLNVSSSKAEFNGAVSILGNVEMNNTVLSKVGYIEFNDPGNQEGIRWNGGNTQLFESPNNLGNGAGNLQVTHGGTRRLSVSDSGAEVVGHLQTDSATLSGLKYPTSDGLNNHVLRTDGSGNLSFASVTALSGNLDSAQVIAVIDSAYVQARQSGGAITVQEEGSSLSTSATTLNFVGTSVTATGSGATKTITISSGTDSSATQAMIDSSIGFQVDSSYVQARQSAVGITVQEEGSSLSTAGTTLNFVGDNVTATGSGATKTITITGGSGTTGTINNVSTSSFSGDASTKAFTLTEAPADSDDAFVFVNGLLQHTNTYSISGTTLTLDSAPDSSSEIEVRTHQLLSSNLVLRDYKPYLYTIDALSDSVSGQDSSGTTLAYDVGKVEVYLNGARLATGKDFTATNGTSIVFDSAVSAGSIVEVVSLAKASTVEINGIRAIDSDLLTTGSNQIIHTFAAASFRTMKYVAQLEHDSSNSYHAEEILLTHNGTNVAMTTYGQVLLDSTLGTFDADINSGNVRLKLTPTKTNVSFKLREIRTPA